MESYKTDYFWYCDTFQDGGQWELLPHGRLGIGTILCHHHCLEMYDSIRNNIISNKTE